LALGAGTNAVENYPATRVACRDAARCVRDAVDRPPGPELIDPGAGVLRQRDWGTTRPRRRVASAAAFTAPCAVNASSSSRAPCQGGAAPALVRQQCRGGALPQRRRASMLASLALRRRPCLSTPWRRPVYQWPCASALRRTACARVLVQRRWASCIAPALLCQPCCENGAAPTFRCRRVSGAV
jgi:hypothetical protein